MVADWKPASVTSSVLLPGLTIIDVVVAAVALLPAADSDT